MRNLAVIVAGGIVLATVVHFASADWPAYRSDVGRSGFAATELPSELAVAWVHRPGHGPRPAWPQPARGSYWQRLSSLNSRVDDDVTFHPVVAHDAVFFGSSADDTVYCLELATGAVRWRFTTDGPIRFAPAVTGGRVLVGSDDGHVYCLTAAGGQLAWKRRLAPEDRRIPGNGRIISAWPVRTGLLVDGGTLYAVCGLFPSQGVFVYALDVAAGDVVWRRPIDHSAQGYLLCSENRLFVPTGRSNPIVLDKSDGRLLAELSGVGGTFAVVTENELVAGRGNDGTLAASDAKTRQRLIDFRGTQMAVSPSTSFLLGQGKLKSIARSRFMQITRKIVRLETEREKSKQQMEKLKAELNKVRGSQDRKRQESAAAEKIEAITALRHEFQSRSRELAKLNEARSSCINWESPIAVDSCLAACRNQVVAGGDHAVIGLDLRDGRQLWNAKIDGRALGIALAEEHVVVSCHDGTLVCLAAGPRQQTPVATRGSDDVRGAASLRASPGHPAEVGNDQRPPADDPPLAEGGLLVGLGDLIVGGPGMRGYCLLVGVGDGSLAEEIAQMSEFVVVAVDRDAERVAAARRYLHAAGLYGDRVAVHHVEGDRLPMTDYMANFVICRSAIEGGEPAWPMEEINRVCRPGNGYAMIKQEGLIARRGPLAGAGQWTHQFASPANTASSGDQHVSHTAALQWFGGPGPHRMVDRHLRGSAPLSADGRLFIPGENRLIAIDAYNGTELWDVELPNSQRYSMPFDAGYMTAANAYVVIAVEDAAWVFRASDGSGPDHIALPESLEMPHAHWGYLAAMPATTTTAASQTAGMRLFGTAQKPTASRTSPSRDQVDVDYRNTQPVVTSDAAFCYDRDGKVAWTYRGGAIINPTITLADDQMYFVESRNKQSAEHATGRIGLSTLLASASYVVALDQATGEIVWEQPLDDHLRRCRNVLFMQYDEQKSLLVATGSYHGSDDDTWYRVAAFDGKDGALRWHAEHANGKKGEFSHGEQHHHPVILGPWLVAEPAVYDLATGQRINPDGGDERGDARGETPWQIVRPGHSCGTMSGAGSCLFFRAGNPTVLNLSTELAGKNRYFKLSPSRPGCFINVIPAGGLILIPEASASCICHYSLQTSMAFLPVEAEDGPAEQRVPRDSVSPVHDAGSE